MDLQALERSPAKDDYLFGRGPAWFAFGMTLALMVFDYVDRQVIVSLFPYLKAEWQLSDRQLGALVSIVSVTVAVGALPIALYADRASRVRSIVAMAGIWSLATLSCMWARGYTQLLAARAFVGLGEAGYGSVGAAVIASHFPSRMRGTMLAAFFASAAVGSVLGVMLGGVIASRWSWQAAFGVVGIPGLLLALLYSRVRDYPTVALDAAAEARARSLTATVGHIARLLARTRTMLWVCAGASAQLVVVSALWSWLPSFLNRVHGVAPAQAGLQAALVVLAGAAGAVLWGALIDRVGLRRPRRKLAVLALLCCTATLVLVAAFSLPPAAPLQFALIVLGGFLGTCTTGPATAIVMDVVHPGVRATGSSVLALTQNLLGLAVGPVVAGVLSDVWGLQAALTATPLFGLLAGLAFVVAARSYEADKARANEPVEGMATAAAAQVATAPR